MPTTGNQNQDNPSFEEPAFAQNAVNTPATEVVMSEESVSQPRSPVIESSEGDGAVSSTVMDQDATADDAVMCTESASESDVQLEQNFEAPSGEVQRAPDADHNVVLETQDSGEFSSHVDTGLEDNLNPSHDSDPHSHLSPVDIGHVESESCSISHIEEKGNDGTHEDVLPSSNAVVESAPTEQVDPHTTETVEMDVDQSNIDYQDMGKEELLQENVAESSLPDDLQQNTGSVESSSFSTIVTETGQDVSTNQDESLVTDTIVSEQYQVPETIVSEQLDPGISSSEQPCSSENATAGNAPFDGISVETGTNEASSVENATAGNAPFDGISVETGTNEASSVDTDVIGDQVTPENVPTASNLTLEVSGVDDSSNVGDIEQTVSQNLLQETMDVASGNSDTHCQTIDTACHSNGTEPSCASNEIDQTVVSGTALVTSLDDEFGPAQDDATSLSPSAQFAAQPLSSTNSFQSAFAAFASGTTSNIEENSSIMEVDETPNSQPCHAADSESSKTTESKKISVLEMPGAIGFRGSQVEAESVATPADVEELVTDETRDQTPVMVEKSTEQVDEQQIVPSESTTSELSAEATTVASDAVYFIQMTDPSGEVVTSIIDPNDIASYSDSIVYRQCMGADGQIETTIVTSQEEQSQQQVEQAEPQPELEQQVIYAHNLNGQLTPIDSAQSANDVAPPGKQFVYMQDSSGRIIRTIMDANQTMVPGQQVYYTQSEDGRIITSVMDSESSAETSQYQQSQEAQVSRQEVQQQVSQPQEENVGDPSVATQSQPSTTPGFSMDNSMSGLSMLAELSQSHLTAGQAPVETKGSSNENSSQDGELDEFRPVAMITRRVTEDGLETVSSDMATLKVASGMQGAEGARESILAKLTAEIKTNDSLPVTSVSRDNLFVQWQNLDAMCWMDVVLIMLVYSPSLQPLVSLDSSHELASTLLITLLKANRQAQVLLQNLLKRSSESSTLQNGTGNAASSGHDPKASKLVCKENMDEIGKAINILYSMREQIWRALQPRLRCERGKHNSPVLVLPLLVREKPIIKQMFTMNFRYVFKCDKCGYSQDDSHSKILPTIPGVPVDFNMKDPCFMRNCFECKVPNQRMFVKFEGLNDFVQMHFVKGLPHNRFEELSFDHNNDHYEVSAVVHYKNNPDHFIAWVRNAPGNTWMECDDLKSVITRYQNVKPNIPPCQVHMVMWERRLTPRHTLVMRDTEDTKLLSSLVLTVQQPGGSQTTQDTASTAKAAGVSPLSTQGMTQGTASSVLSGLISQSQQSANNFSPYTPRGRGSRGARGGRGSRGSRGSTVTIRRGVGPGATQMVSPAMTSAAIRQPGSPQIIRLPLSALQGMGAQLRGSSSVTSPQRLILMGGNSNAQAAHTTASAAGPKKVVVVRSQDGSSSLNQLSAAQLLQLLQRTGAISNANTRITTTISRAASDGTPQHQTITLTPEIPASQHSASTTGMECDYPEAQAVHATTPSESAHSGTILSGEAAPEIPMEVDPPSTDEAQMREPQAVIAHQEEESALTAAPASSTEVLPEELASTAATSMPVLSTLVTDSNVQSNVSTVSINSGAIRSLNRAGLGDGNRYVQIPNPKGGPNIMTQLVVRGDKMVLVPVDKSQLPSSVPPTVRISTASSMSGSLQTSSATNSTQIFSSGSLSSTTTSTGAPGQTTRFITIPGGQGQGGKRTIQLISVPRGTTASGASPGSAKTFIVGPSGSQAGTRIITQPQGDATQQAGNIIFRELKQPEDETVSVTPATSVALSGEGAAPTLLTNTSTVSLLKDVAIKSSEDGTQGISILSQSAVQMATKPQESFRYILPGSNTQQLSSIQAVSGAQLGSKAFTALSSSGTIIGGQLTPVTANTPDMVPSPVESVDAGVQSIYPELDAINPSLVTTPWRGRGRGRGGRGGRGRGIKTPSRGRGVRQQQVNQQTFNQVQTKVVGRSGTISMLPADFHGVGGQIIETSTESVDGAPVVSIPDFSPVVTTTQSESVVATESGPVAVSSQEPMYQSVQTVAMPSSLSPVHVSSSLTTQESATEPLVSQGPKVITQSIPSYKANHGFDILTQGILGNANGQGSTTPRKTGISLLTGKQVTSPPTTNLSTTFTSGVSRMQQTLAMGHSVTQSEIETLIKAAQGAAKPPKPGQSETGSTTVQLTQEGQVVRGEDDGLAQAQGFNVDDFLSAEKTEDRAQIVEEKLDSAIEEGGEKKDSSVPEGQESTDNIDCAEHEKRIFSIDESQVSAAERYRMPTELFQPDEESPEKPVRNDALSHQFSSSNILGEDLPTKLFHDSEINSHDDEAVKSLGHKQLKEPENDSMGELQPSIEECVSEKEVITSCDVSMEDHVSSSDLNQEFVGDTEEKNVELAAVTSPSKKGHKKSKGKGQNKSDNRRKSSNSFSSDAETAISSPPTIHSISSPKKESILAADTSQNEPCSHDGLSPEKESIVKTVLEETSEPSIIGHYEDMKWEEGMEVKEQIEEHLDAKAFDSKADEREENQVKFIKKKREGKKNVNPIPIKVKSILHYSPTPVCKKRQKADWSQEEVTNQTAVFIYRFLTSSRRKVSKRHFSLGPPTSSFTSPPVPLISFREKEDNHEPVSSIVKRRHPKALERPKVDPSKEPTVIPLVPEEDADPACTCGGSVVTSHSEGEVFTGVVVRQRPEMADWNNGVFEEEGDSSSETSEKWEDKELWKEYVETMWTSMCMEVGFQHFFESFTLYDNNESEDYSMSDVSEEDDVITESEELEEKDDDESMELVSLAGNGKRKTDDEHFESENLKRRKVSKDNSSEIMNDTNPLKSSPSSDTVSPLIATATDADAAEVPTKLEAAATAEAPMTEMLTIEKSHPPAITEVSTTQISTAKTSILTTTSVTQASETTVGTSSRVNGISNTESSRDHISTLPFILSSTPPVSTAPPPPPPPSSSSKKRGASSPAFISPARRSSRTPVPSKKLKDSLEEGAGAIKMLSKARRSSLVSSDEDVSGYSSDEVAIKKKVKKYVQS